jgi:hypothetical protein
VALGASGHFVLIGTASSNLLMVFGTGLMLVAFVRLRMQTRDGERRAEDAGLDVQQRATFDRLSADLRARVEGRAERFSELQAIIETTPGATAQLAELLLETNGRMQPYEQLDHALEAARRLDAEHRADLRAEAD